MFKGESFPNRHKFCVHRSFDHHHLRCKPLTLPLRNLKDFSLTKMYFSKATVFFTIIPFTLATDCTVSDSSPWPFGVTDDCAQFDTNTEEYQACQEVALQGQCYAMALVDGSDCSDSSDSSGGGGDLISDPGDDLISSGFSGDSGLEESLQAQSYVNDVRAAGADLISGSVRKLRARAPLSCSSSETCYQYGDSLVCYDMATGR